MSWFFFYDIDYFELMGRFCTVQKVKPQLHLFVENSYLHSGKLLSTNSDLWAKLCVTKMFAQICIFDFMAHKYRLLCTGALLMLKGEYIHIRYPIHLHSLNLNLSCLSN